MAKLPIVAAVRISAPQLAALHHTAAAHGLLTGAGERFTLSTNISALVRAVLVHFLRHEGEGIFLAHFESSPQATLTYLREAGFHAVLAQLERPRVASHETRQLVQDTLEANNMPSAGFARSIPLHIAPPNTAPSNTSNNFGIVISESDKEDNVPFHLAGTDMKQFPGWDLHHPVNGWRWPAKTLNGLTPMDHTWYRLLWPKHPTFPCEAVLTPEQSQEITDSLKSLDISAICAWDGKAPQDPEWAGASTYTDSVAQPGGSPGKGEEDQAPGDLSPGAESPMNRSLA